MELCLPSRFLLIRLFLFFFHVAGAWWMQGFRGPTAARAEDKSEERDNSDLKENEKYLKLAK